MLEKACYWLDMSKRKPQPTQHKVSVRDQYMTAEASLLIEASQKGFVTLADADRLMALYSSRIEDVTGLGKALLDELVAADVFALSSMVSDKTTYSLTSYGRSLAED